ncbi:MAG: zinc ABC transporter substrate-binding protein [Pseudomonadota bacterium]
MKYLKTDLYLLIFIAFICGPASAGGLIAVSIPPLKNVVEDIAGDAFDVDLLISETESPHHANLKPTGVRSANNADMIIWLGASYETGMVKLIRSLPETKPVLGLLSHKAIAVLPHRQLHSVSEDSEHSGAKGDDHSERYEGHEEEGADDNEYEHGLIDPHIWLSPHTMIEVVNVIARELGTLEPSEAVTFRQNARALSERIEALELRMREALEPVRHVQFMVYYDALQYFEHSFGLTGGQAVTLNPVKDIGSVSVAATRSRMNDQNIACFFAEPQFGDKVLQKYLPNRDTEIYRIDPVGNTDWFDLMETLVAGLVDCLGKPEVAA